MNTGLYTVLFDFWTKDTEYQVDSDNYSKAISYMAIHHHGYWKYISFEIWN